MRQCAPVLDDIDYSARLLGSLLGGAVGDAFGYEVEFMNTEAISKKFGSDGIVSPVFHEGRLLVSDDTQMTLFTMEGITACRSGWENHDSVVNSIHRSYLEWLDTQLHSTLINERGERGWLRGQQTMWANRAPGNTCISALKAGGNGTVVAPINDSKGCGGVMRVAPIGWAKQWTSEQAFEIACAAAALTHGHPTGFFAAGVMAAIIRLLMDGEELLPAVHRGLSLVPAGKGVDETRRAAEMAITLAQGDDDVKTSIAALGRGWIAEEALAIGLFAALRGNDFPEVISIAANHDGDSDSTASIAGQLFGAWKGYSRSPTH